MKGQISHEREGYQSLGLCLPLLHPQSTSCWTQVPTYAGPAVVARSRVLGPGLNSLGQPAVTERMPGWESFTLSFSPNPVSDAYEAPELATCGLWALNRVNSGIGQDDSLRALRG